MKEESYKNFYLSMLVGIFAIKGFVNGFEFGLLSYEFWSDLIYGISIFLLTVFYVFEKELRFANRSESVEEKK